MRRRSGGADHHHSGWVVTVRGQSTTKSLYTPSPSTSPGCAPPVGCPNPSVNKPHGKSKPAFAGQKLLWIGGGNKTLTPNRTSKLLRYRPLCRLDSLLQHSPPLSG